MGVAGAIIARRLKLTSEPPMLDQSRE